MDDSHFESITHSVNKRHDTRRGLERSETTSRLFQSLWMCGTYPYFRCKRNKLEDKSVTCVLFGVSSESKGYRMFDPTTNKIIVSRM